jgi:hypothetical protein
MSLVSQSANQRSARHSLLYPCRLHLGPWPLHSASTPASTPILSCCTSTPTRPVAFILLIESRKPLRAHPHPLRIDEAGNGVDAVNHALNPSTAPEASNSKRIASLPGRPRDRNRSIAGKQCTRRASTLRIANVDAPASSRPRFSPSASDLTTSAIVANHRLNTSYALCTGLVVRVPPHSLVLGSCAKPLLLAF